MQRKEKLMMIMTMIGCGVIMANERRRRRRSEKKMNESKRKWINCT